MTAKRKAGGRATPAKRSYPAGSPNPGASTPRPTPERSAARQTQPAEQRTPEETGRYTAPKHRYRVRPRWHRAAGWTGVGVGVLIAVLNDGMLLTEGLVLLPFGHSELYLILAVCVAAASSWFLGLFDHGTTIFR